MSTLGSCEFCGGDVDAFNAAWPVKGWEATRTGGGANRIIDRERLPGRIAHVRCVEDEAQRRRRGIAREQQTLG